MQRYKIFFILKHFCAKYLLLWQFMGFCSGVGFGVRRNGSAGYCGTAPRQRRSRRAVCKNPMRRSVGADTRNDGCRDGCFWLSRRLFLTVVQAVLDCRGGHSWLSCRPFLTVTDRGVVRCDVDCSCSKEIMGNCGKLELARNSSYAICEIIYHSIIFVVTCWLTALCKMIDGMIEW